MNEIIKLIGRKIHRTLIGTRNDDDFDYEIRDITKNGMTYILRCWCEEKHKKKWKFGLTEDELLKLIYSGHVSRMSRKSIFPFKGIYGRDTIDLLCGDALHVIETFVLK